MLLYKKLFNSNFFFNNLHFKNSKKVEKKMSLYFKIDQLFYKKFKFFKKKLSFKLKVTYRRRNTFFVITDHLGFIVDTTTIRRQGFYGRRRRQYTAMQGTLRSIKKKLKMFFIKNLEVTFIRSNRFSYMVRKVLRNWEWRFKLSRYKTILKPKIPHNGTRSIKSKNRRRLKWKRFFRKVKRNRLKTFNDYFKKK